MQTALVLSRLSMDTELPLMVKEFLKEADLQTNYFYIILTYGNRHGGAAELAKELCDSCGITVNYINVLLMVDNWLPSFDMDEQQKIDKKVEEQIAVIQTEIRAQKKHDSSGYGRGSQCPSAVFG